MPVQPVSIPQFHVRALPRCLFLFGLISCMLATVNALAEPETGLQAPRVATQRQRQFRIPPQAAIDACVDRSEGDPCSFTTPRGTLTGQCLARSEDIFACRPNRGIRLLDTPTTGSVEQPVPNSTTEQAPVLPSQTTPSPNPAAAPAASAKAPPASNEASQANAPPSPPVVSPAPASSVDSLSSQIPSFWSHILTAVIAASLTGYLFYVRFVRPLRHLRYVTQQLGRGELSARIGEDLTARNSAVAALGRDVDRMAERIENLVGAQQRLVRDISHELRSPLARLNVALELASTSAGPRLSAPFARIAQESDRLNELIGQLLMLTKLENGSGAERRSQLDLTALLGEIVQDADFEAKGHERQVTATLGEPILLNGDRELLRQALENVVRNAVRYTAAGTAVEITLRRKDAGRRSWARIEVRDHGPGVPESELYDIFRPFYRVNDARERKSGGTGVGLAISDRAVRLHGGSIRAFNAPGGGLVMELELPLD